MDENTIFEEQEQIEDNLEEIEVKESEGIEETQEVLEETVSMGDAIPFAISGEDGTSLTVEDITLAINDAEVTVAAEPYTLWDKPLEEYTVTEGLLLILVLCAVGLCISRIIGGVLNCKFLLRK